MGIELELLGGPQDGATVRIPAEDLVPGFVYKVIIPVEGLGLYHGSFDPMPLTENLIAVYRWKGKSQWLQFQEWQE